VCVRASVCACVSVFVCAWVSMCVLHYALPTRYVLYADEV